MLHLNLIAFLSHFINNFHWQWNKFWVMTCQNLFQDIILRSQFLLKSPSPQCPKSWDNLTGSVPTLLKSFLIILRKRTTVLVKTPLFFTRILQDHIISLMDKSLTREVYLISTLHSSSQLTRMFNVLMLHYSLTMVLLS